MCDNAEVIDYARYLRLNLWWKELVDELTEKHEKELEQLERDQDLVVQLMQSEIDQLMSKGS